jgi:phenylpropionate dioxygenase-like ring-hydroxylating dioxygenase large terminal subunit
MAANRFGPEAVRDDFVPKEDYLDPEFAKAEFDNLWPKVWQIVCRFEEIPKVGDYVTYDIGNDSIIVIRSGEKETDVKAFHNTCPHRGTQLVDGGSCGHTKQFVCPFHGWRFAIDGKKTHVPDEKDWGDSLKNLTLSGVKVDFWGGWVWINMDPNCQPLADFLEPVKGMCEKYEFEKLRFAWYKTAIVPANWKTVVEGFNEFYHVQTTHAQMLAYTNDYSITKEMGRHGWVAYDANSGFPLGRSPRLPPKEEKDYRQYIFQFSECLKHDLQTMQTERAYQAIQRLKTEVSADAQPAEVLQKYGEFIYEAAIKDGAGWPADLTPDYMAKSGYDWHVFPNTIFLHGSVESVLWYRMRPNGTDVNSCIFDIWSLERFAPGKEPPLKREYYADWEKAEWPKIFIQDFTNMPKVQKGMMSRGFKGGLTNPVQERTVSNFHRTLRRFMQDPHADDHIYKQVPKNAAE